ncbi:hypothetical protein N0V86_006663 [Didymella sp. IMI 355093]|nr:hypothetical protein N0V86_006663 [Didymella sp. IMI 355093]
MSVQRPIEPNDPDHYWGLGDMDTRATAAEIRKAYLHLSMQYHPDKLPVGASDTRFKKIQTACETLSNASTRADYDLRYPIIRNAWAKYDTALERWRYYEAQRKRCEEERRRRDSEVLEKMHRAEEQRRQRKAEANRKYREKKLRRGMAEREAKTRLDTETRSREAAEKKTRDDREKKEREEDSQRRADEQLQAEELTARDRAEQLEARQRLRQQQAEAREQGVAARAQAAQRKVAQEQLRRDQEKEDAIRKAQQIVLLHAQEDYFTCQRHEESAYDDQWYTIAQLAQAEDEERLRQVASERARLERSAAEDQHRMAQERQEAKLRRDSKHQDADVRFSLEELEREHSRFIQEIMAICGESKDDVLKDVVLITVEAVDSEIQTQKTREQGRKRKRATEDPARLPAFVTELFAKLKSGGESSERYRFGKKRTLG